MSDEGLDRFQERLGYQFADLVLLETALTHRSYANERNLDEQYERLEFLGDAVLGLVVAAELFARHPELAEGELSKRKSRLVSEPALARYAEQLGLGDLLRLGVGEERSGGRDKPSLLADALEAIFGAVYLDGGGRAARPVVLRFVEAALPSLGEPAPEEAKTRLQELIQGRGQSLPEYRLVATEGPDHEKLFVVECRLEDGTVGVGEGPTKKAAEQRAAAAALLAASGD